MSGSKISFPDSVVPRSKMGRNEPCWCGSGKKWKNCHLNRAEARPKNYFEVRKDTRKIYEKGKCLHPSAPEGCVGGVIRSHTIQRSSALNAIAESGHVMWAREGVERLHQNKGKLVPQKVGVRDASTFRGFCSKHDAEVFLPVEKVPFEFSRENAALLMFRAVSLELYQKRSAIESLERNLDADAGGSSFRQAFVQNVLRDMIFAMRLGLTDVEKLKERLDRSILASDFSDINMAVVEMDRVLPVLAAFAVQPDFDFAGRTIQDLANENLEQAAVTVTVLNGRTVCVISYYDDGLGAAKNFASSLVQANEDDMATILALGLFAMSENVLINPSFWGDLSEQSRGYVSNLIRIGTPDFDAPTASNAMDVSRSPFRIEAKVVRKVLYEATDSSWA